MSLTDKLTSLNNEKQSLKTVFTEKGYNMSSIPFTEYHTLLSELPIHYDYYVSSRGSDSNTGTSKDTPFLTLNKAVTTATSNQSICVLAGTYTGVNNCDLTISKNLNITGETSTIFDGSSTRRSGWTISLGYSVNISNITFQYGQTATGGYDGGGIQNSGTGDINNCIFKYNTSTADGGAIKNFGGGNITNCIFLSNTSTGYGGAIYNINKDNVNITDCTFKTNQSTNKHYGDAIYTEKVTILKNNDFLATNYTNIFNYKSASIIDNTYWNTSTPTSSSYNSTLNGSTVTNDRTTPNHPERII